jgi:hypothetical protein
MSQTCVFLKGVYHEIVQLKGFHESVVHGPQIDTLKYFSYLMPIG